MDLGNHAQTGILALLGTIIAALFTWRGINRVKNDNARENRESRHEENIQDRLDSALHEVRRLNAELLDSKDGRAVLERRFKEARRVNSILLEMLEKDRRESAERWVQASTFAPLDPKD